MLVSLKWLAKYINIPVSHQDLETKLSLTGLNHEGTTEINDDIVIDLEVTSNRGDCLGHLGVAREIGVLYDVPVQTPSLKIAQQQTNQQQTNQPDPTSGGTSAVDELLTVENQFDEACSRYTARVIRGVKIGPSPQWLVDHLSSVFWKRKFDGSIEPYQSVNNVVDATNFVMMECGQPLHAFDYSKLTDHQIVVRPGNKGEKLQAIDHREYELDPTVCVIADGAKAAAVAGVMGGAATEVTESTQDLVIEAAIFTPLNVRRAARRLKLHSPSSYRFERKVDPVGVDWASRRVCELITEMAGGELVDGVIDTAPEIPARAPVVLRLDQVERILGIKIDREEIARILVALGCESSASNDVLHCIPPTWRHDLTREADLIEEVARIHGYEKIPEDAPIPVTPSSKRSFDTAVGSIRKILTAAGLTEAMTPSVVTKKLDSTLSPWTDLESLATETAMLKGSKQLRRSLIPSLLEGRAANWAAASIAADLFEIAHIYLPGKEQDGLPSEKYAVGIISGSDFFNVKGTLQLLCSRLGIDSPLEVELVDRDGFAKGQIVQVKIDETLVGYLGTIDPKTAKSWKLPDQVVAAELSLTSLLEKARLVPQQQSVSQFPSIQRDLNLVMNESVRWNELESVVRSAVGTELADVRYQETYRDADRDGKDRKRVLLTVELQRDDATLSGDQADSLIDKVIAACDKQLSAELLS